MALKSLLKTVIGIAASFALLLLTGPVADVTTDYQRELGGIARKSMEPSPTADLHAALFKNAYLAFLKSALTAEPKDIETAGIAFDKALANLGDSPELRLLHAAYNLKLHHLEAAKADLAALSFMRDDPRVQVLEADIAVQEGELKQAEARLAAILEHNRNWDNLSRLAHLRAKSGDFATADRLYLEAEDGISAKDMRSFAWVELQRGYLALSHGQHREAEEHYRQAGQAYSGYWLTREYGAELLGAQGNYAAAAALYLEIIRCTKRPELYHALGDLYLYMGKPELAEPWHDKALAVYLDAAKRGDVQYYHHLASLFADARLDGEEAVKWAQKDIELRKNAATLDSLAWALFRAGRYPSALNEAKKALAFGWQDAHLIYHAAMIHLAAGQAEAGKTLLRQAAALNPHYEAFHVHR